ncbi:MAG: hypothetical protein ACK559_06140, partial [bacterium]
HRQPKHHTRQRQPSHSARPGPQQQVHHQHHHGVVAQDDQVAHHDPRRIQRERHPHGADHPLVARERPAGVAHHRAREAPQHQ